MDTTSKANSWLQSSAIDAQTKEEIKELMEHPKELEDAFHMDLEFGTGGLRGTMGVGSNRMNKYTVGMATQGLANYLKLQFPNTEIKVAIAHDSRNNSDFFTQITSDVFTANGIHVYRFKELRPTPQLSYAIRQLKCQSGVVITASHNPKEYNGYKAYWTDGAQLIGPHDKGVIAEVRKIALDQVRFKGNPELVHELGTEMDDSYLNAVQSLTQSQEIDKEIKIVYSSIHGTGITLVPQALAKNGYSNVTVVDEQAQPDGNFPTVVYPNPEEKEAMSLALNKAQKLGADVVMATDPDADRVGIGLPNQKGEYQLLNGNQTGALIVYYILKMQSEKGFKGNEFIAKTIVTSDLLSDIASHFQVKSYETLTGFKFIAELIREKEGKEKYLCGGEESYGYMISDYVRDKDAVASCAMIAEVCGWAKAQGKTLFDLLLDIYSQNGFYLESLLSMTKKGVDGAKEIRDMMERYRKTPPTSLGGAKITHVIDYQSGTKYDVSNKATSTLRIGTSNVLQFLTEDGSKISLRPSGTEPKIKFYFSVRTSLPSKAEFEKRQLILENKLDSLRQDLID
jgi:phosphoglucomutase